MRTENFGLWIWDCRLLSCVLNLHSAIRNPHSAFTMTSLSAYEIALGRSRTYALLGRLYRRALDDEAMDYVRAIPRLAASVAPEADLDELAAAYQDLFGFNVFPYQTLFLDPAGRLGGPEKVRVQQSLAAVHYRPDPENADDHIAGELALLAFLCGAEADARRDGLDATANEVVARQAEFLADHLLRWIAPFVAAVQRTGAPFYRELAALTLDFVANHTSAHLSAATSVPLSPAALSLEDDATDLRAIVNHLLQTPASGIYLARADLMRLGRTFNLPRGFGDRRQLFLNLLRTAATYDAFITLVNALADDANDFDQRYAAMAAGHPTLTPWITPWREQAQATEELLRRLARLSEAIDN